ncbi:hypothetical protein MAR_009667 [Mya arenaria]|uniref:USP domain-containing protein n=1 Tax=Mya arenaria TaxID=6604 RepID=A0ABY7E3Z0_MYAAR|nr:hypothetical protein MAR_009667 [Mya arenaria]
MTGQTCLFNKKCTKKKQQAFGIFLQEALNLPVSEEAALLYYGKSMKGNMARRGEMIGDDDDYDKSADESQVFCQQDIVSTLVRSVDVSYNNSEKAVSQPGTYNSETYGHAYCFNQSDSNEEQFNRRIADHNDGTHGGNYLSPRNKYFVFNGVMQNIFHLTRTDGKPKIPSSFTVSIPGRTSF